MTITTQDLNKLHREVRIGVMSGMETGNFDYARTLLKEYRAVDKERAEAIAADVVEAYNIAL